MAESDIYIFFSNSFSSFEDRFPSKQIYFHICKFLKWYFENGIFEWYGEKYLFGYCIRGKWKSEKKMYVIVT